MSQWKRTQTCTWHGCFNARSHPISMIEGYRSDWELDPEVACDITLHTQVWCNKDSPRNYCRVKHLHFRWSLLRRCILPIILIIHTPTIFGLRNSYQISVRVGTIQPLSQCVVFQVKLLSDVVIWLLILDHNSDLLLWQRIVSWSALKDVLFPLISHCGKSWFDRNSTTCSNLDLW